MPQTISKEAEEKILDHIGKVVAAVDDEGLHPTEALTKIAREAEIPPNVIRLVSRAYNTGRQESQRKSASTILDKFASFPLADGEAAVRAIYPTYEDDLFQDKEAVSEDYAFPPCFLGTAEQQEREKLARAELPPLVEKPVAPYEESSEQRMARAYHSYLKEKRACDTVRHQESAAHDRLFLAIGQLGDYFKHGGDVSLQEAKWVAENYMGKAASDLLRTVEVRNGKPEPSVPEDASGEVKEAAEFLRSRRQLPASEPPTEIHWNREPYLLMKAAIIAAEEVWRLRQSHRHAMDKLAEAEELLRPFVQTPSPAAASIIARKDKEARGGLGSMAKGIGLKSLFDMSLKPKPVPEMVGQQQEELEDPAHEDELRKIRAQAMIQDLLNNDEVISGYSPDEVLNAYNEIAAMMPRASTQPGVMRPMLRRRLQGHVEPFEAEQATTIEKGLAQTSNTTPSSQRLGNAPASILG